jgi:hypothetical protein
MSHAHELVRAALRGGGAEGVHWHRLMAAVREVAGGAVAGGGGSELPHAMPPEEMLGAHAVQALARADLDRHRAAIQRVADAPDSSERLAGIARWVLKDSEK